MKRDPFWLYFWFLAGVLFGFVAVYAFFSGKIMGPTISIVPFAFAIFSFYFAWRSR